MNTFVDGTDALFKSMYVSRYSFLFAARLAAAAVLAQLADGLKCGAKRAEQRAPLAGRSADRRLHGVQGFVHSHRDVAEQLVGALHLRRGERRGARGVARNRVDVAE